MAFIENAKEVLLSVLEIPHYAWPEYFIKKQKESDWSKDVFLKTLEAEYQSYNADYLRERRKALDLNPNINDNEVGKLLEEETNGKIKKVFLGFGRTTHLINDLLLKKWLHAIKEAYSIDQPNHTYSDLDIIHITERALEFIHNEFEEQAGLKKIELFFRSAPKGYTGKTENGEDLFLLHDYYIQGPEPIFNYYTFKQAIRNLLLNSQRPEQLKIILEPTLKRVRKIIQVWNDHLQELDSGVGKYIKSRKLIKYDDLQMSDYTILLNEKFLDFSVEAKHYTNHKLVKFAFSVGTLIAHEILETVDVIKSIKETKPSVASYALVHIYWSKYDTTKAITKTNKEVFAKNYGISHNTLYTEFNNYLDKESRTGLPAGKERKNAIFPYIKRFEDAAIMLREIHQQAYNDITNDLNYIKERYDLKDQ